MELFNLLLFSVWFSNMKWNSSESIKIKHLPKTQGGKLAPRKGKARDGMIWSITWVFSLPLLFCGYSGHRQQ